MALKLGKSEVKVKKSSYYVWFLGAKESKGLRGTEYILPVIKHLEEREKDVEPFKVTLQVSHKGLKIIQNIVSTNPKNSKPKNETIKHFIPHNTITCVYQHEDVIACILLLFNPVTKCPLHVHAYRCDSLETATLLKNQLQLLIDKPENQKKFAEIENRLKPQKELKKVESSIGSDTGTSTRESESSEERYAVENTRVTTLYDSVAAELREKLGKKNSPILLPPRDYDTVHRTKGNLTGIELRRCLNANIVGQNVKGMRLESSGGSSGIGSDHPPSPDSPDSPHSRFNNLDNQSTSDEEWNGDPADSSVYLMQPAHVRKSPEPMQRHQKYPEPQSPTKYNKKDETTKYLERPFSKYLEKEFLERQRSMEREKMQKKLERQKSGGESERSSKTVDRNVKYFGTNPEDDWDKYNKRGGRYDDGKKQDMHEFERRGYNEKYFDSDGFNEPVRYRSKSTEFTRNRQQRYIYDEEDYPEKTNQPMPKTRQKYIEEDSHSKEKSWERPRFKPDDPKYYDEPKSTSSQKDRYERHYSEERSVRSQEYQEDVVIRRKDPQLRQRSPSVEEVKHPKDRFKDAKEKFLLMEQEQIEHERRRPESPISPVHKPTSPLGFMGGKGHSRNSYEERFFEAKEESRPKPAPRNIMDKQRYREEELESYERYKNTDKFDPKRRSMFSLIEEEHRKNSNEIARELKRRSYMDRSNYEEDNERYYRQQEQEKYLENYAKSNAEMEKVNEQKYDGKYVKNPKGLKNGSPAGYRHSYVEPKARNEKNGRKNFFDMLHRTNSSVSSNGRVGIASVHPY